MPTSPTPITALPTAPSRADPANFPTRADAFLGALGTFGTQANAVATNAYNNAVEATNAATAAGSSQTAAASSASAATASQTAAASSASAAAGSASSATALYDLFDDRFLGSKATAPTLDNDANALTEGALYWDSTAKQMRVYDGSAWRAAYVPAETYLPLTGGSVSGPLTLSGGTANGVLYLNGSKVATSGTALAFDGTVLTTPRTVLSLSAGSTDSGTTNSALYLNVGTPATTANLIRFAGAVSSDLYFGRAINADAFAWGVVGGSELMRIATATGGVGAVGIGYSSLTSVGNNGLAVAGNVGIGTSSPGAKLDVQFAGVGIQLKQSVVGAATYYVMDNTVETGGKRWRFGYTGAAGIPTFSLYNATDNVTAWVADASGNLGLGATAIRAKLVVNEYTNTSYTELVAFTGAKGSFVGIPTNQLAIVDSTAQAAGVGGEISFEGKYNASDTTSFAAVGGVKENSTSSDYGGAFVVRTRANGGNLTERARISSDGTFRVKGAGTAGSTDAVQFSGSAPASALALDASGRLLVGATSASSGARATLTSAAQASGSACGDSGILLYSTTNLATGEYAPFITWSGNATNPNRARAAIGAVSTATNTALDLVFLTRSAADASEIGTGSERARITSTGNVVAGGSVALATTATDGFLYVPTCAGTPTGTPTAITGMAPIVVNTTNNKLYFYSGGAWRDAGP